jgi:FKBP-type peptidyl-prolyl cis-trans isomerase
MTSLRRLSVSIAPWLVLALAGSASALQDTPATAPNDAPAAQSPAIPPAPVPVPVPDMPVVSSKTLDNGIVIDDMKIGDGYEVKPGDAVVAFYHGTLKADPTKVFDSAFTRGEPIGFPLNGVIKGWQDGVPGMKLGGIRRLTIPAALAYGEQSPSPDIPANSDLVFVIQLVDALQVVDVKEGDGAAATEPCLPVTGYTIHDASGKEIEKCSTDKPHVWIPGEFLTGNGFDALQAGLKGMKVGGKRKIHMPAAFNQPNAGLPSGRPGNIDLNFEIELTGVRNLPSRGG